MQFNFEAQTAPTVMSVIFKPIIAPTQKVKHLSKTRRNNFWSHQKQEEYTYGISLSDFSSHEQGLYLLNLSLF